MLINNLFIGAIVILILIFLIFGIKLYYDVSLEQRKKKFEYIFKIIMKNGSEYVYHFYSNSKKKSREYLLKNFIMENDREIAVEEDGYDSYYPLNEVAKMRMSCSPAKQKVASGKKKKSSVDFDSLFTEEDSEHQEKENESVVIQNKDDNNDTLKGVQESNDTFIPIEEEVAIIEEKELVPTPVKKTLKGGEQVKKEKFYSPTTSFKKNKTIKQEKVPRVKKSVNTKLVTILVWFFLMLLIISGGLAFLKASNVSQSTRKIDSELSLLKKELKEEKNQQVLYTPILEDYMTGFVTTYMNMSEKQEAQSERLNSLKNYYAEGLKVENDSTGDRKLKDFNFYDLTHDNTVSVAQFKVTYAILSKDKKSVEKTVILNIPFKEHEGRFAVVSYPYMTVAENQQFKVKGLEDSLFGEQEVPTEMKLKVEAFLNDFYKKYASLPKKDLQYMMKEPESLNGTSEFDSVSSNVYKEKDSLIVISTVKFKEKDSDITRSEVMKMKLVTKDNKFFVDQLTHHLGGN